MAGEEGVTKSRPPARFFAWQCGEVELRAATRAQARSRGGRATEQRRRSGERGGLWHGEGSDDAVHGSAGEKRGHDPTCLDTAQTEAKGRLRGATSGQGGSGSLRARWPTMEARPRWALWLGPTRGPRRCSRLGRLWHRRDKGAAGPAR